MQHGGPPHKGLGHMLHEQKILGSGEQVLALERAPHVNAFFDVGQQFGGVLNFIQNDGWPPHIEEPSGVGRSGGPHIRRFKRYVAEALAEDMAQQCGFSRLTRPHQHHGGEFPRGLPQDRPEGARQISGHILQLCI